MVKIAKSDKIKNSNNADDRKKIGLFGGSFDPIHNGHLRDIKKVLSHNYVNELWILPCGHHAFNKKLSSPEHRLAMIYYATKDIDNVAIDTTEIFGKQKNYTSETIRKMRDTYKHEFYMVVGSDILKDLSKWHDFKYISETVPFIVIKRDGFPIKNPGINIEKIILEDPTDISSTRIRDLAGTGKSISGLVPVEVEKYVLKNKLYTGCEDYAVPSSTVDLIIPSDKGLLMIKRGREPFKGYWAFPGGFVNYGVETVEQAALRELEEETHAKAELKDLKLLGIYSDPKRDPRGHVISNAFICSKYSGTLKADDDADDIKFFSKKPEKLAFDHSKIWDDYFKSVKNEKE